MLFKLAASILLSVAKKSDDPTIDDPSATK